MIKKLFIIPFIFISPLAGAISLSSCYKTPDKVINLEGYTTLIDQMEFKTELGQKIESDDKPVYVNPYTDSDKMIMYSWDKQDWKFNLDDLGKSTKEKTFIYVKFNDTVKGVKLINNEPRKKYIYLVPSDINIDPEKYWINYSIKDKEVKWNKELEKEITDDYNLSFRLTDQTPGAGFDTSNKGFKDNLSSIDIPTVQRYLEIIKSSGEKNQKLTMEIKLNSKFFTNTYSRLASNIISLLIKTIE